MRDFIASDYVREDLALKEDIRCALAKLTRRQQLIVRLIFEQGLKEGQICKKLGISRKTYERDRVDIRESLGEFL